MGVPHQLEADAALSVNNTFSAILLPKLRLLERPFVTAALVAILVVMSAGLGEVLVGGGGLQGHNPVGQASTQSNQSNAKGPFFLVRTSINGGIFTSSGPPNLAPGFQPIQGVRFVIQGLPTFFRGRLQSNQVTTNSSGMGEIAVPPGNFTVVGAGTDISYRGFVDFKDGTVTVLDVVVSPARGTVASVAVVNQDTLDGVEQTGTIFVGVPGNVTYVPGVVSELLGESIVTAGGPGVGELGVIPLGVNVTVIGTYPYPDGTMVVLRPFGTFHDLLPNGLSLIQYRLNSTVSYIAV